MVAGCFASQLPTKKKSAFHALGARRGWPDKQDRLPVLLDPFASRVDTELCVFLKLPSSLFHASWPGFKGGRERVENTERGYFLIPETGGREAASNATSAEPWMDLGSIGLTCTLREGQVHLILCRGSMVYLRRKLDVEKAPRTAGEMLPL